MDLKGSRPRGVGGSGGVGALRWLNCLMTGRGGLGTGENAGLCSASWGLLALPARKLGMTLRGSGVWSGVTALPGRCPLKRTPDEWGEYSPSLTLDSSREGVLRSPNFVVGSGVGPRET